MIDGYDEAPSCSSFASGSFDIGVIFHVHCTKPVWCVTPQQPPNTPRHPTYAHHKVHTSMVHYPGFPLPPAISIIPFGQKKLHMMAPPFGQPFLPRNRRTPSVSIGGPLKAPLGGPGRKYSPMPSQLPATAQKGKKLNR